ncbi:DUF669 domain-containing protein [Ruminococcus sp. 210702-SL.1.03]|uniref:DUF669 domain-containing protein n=1 Tax=Ruminococcus sp. 210702-SL.1.03 TaxID=2883233 RepID=UPI001D0882DA|nr:DUF669 domain-containing protein [Ruminococcus sp. 210702-SL.1.03]MCB6617090.1 DUF669 domain-containing protein [Ruminococcus sp. 210702-SL.1.03]
MEDLKELGWDDEISDEGEGYSYTLLPEGDYEFTVAKFERARHAGSAKVPPCNMAKVTFTVWGAEDKTEITENYFLCKKFEWKLSQLFLSVGLKKHGEPLRMNWAALTGAHGKCRVYIDNYTKKDGTEGKSNKIRRLYAYDENVDTVKPAAQQHGYTNVQTPQPAQTYQQPPQAAQGFANNAGFGGFGGGQYGGFGGFGGGGR